jgi:hypothetical protein
MEGGGGGNICYGKKKAKYSSKVSATGFLGFLRNVSVISRILILDPLFKPNVLNR